MPSSLLSMGAYDDDEAMPPYNPYNPKDPRDPPCDAIGICPDGTRYDGCAQYFIDPCLGHYKPIIDPPAPDCTGYCEDGTAYDTCAFYIADPCRGHYVDPKSDPESDKICGGYSEEYVSGMSDLWRCLKCDNNTYAECTANQVPKQERDTARSYVSQSGSRQFTVSLSDNEIANLCNCPTESPTQPQASPCPVGQILVPFTATGKDGSVQSRMICYPDPNYKR